MRQESVTALGLGRLYPIVDVHHDGAPQALALAGAVLRAGAPWLQLRCKSIGGAPHLRLAHRLVELAARHGARLIVNDRLDVALLSGAAGVHLGQDDLPLAAARAQAPPELAVGISTHSVDEAIAAERGGASYVGFGPMFATASKRDAQSPRSMAELRALRAAIRLPIVAIGGITEETAPAVLAAGADAVAMIGALAANPDPEVLTRRLLAL